MPDRSGRARRPRGEVETLPSGSLRVRVYAGVDPASRRRRYLTETVPAGPAAQAQAEAVRTRLLAQRDALRSGADTSAAPRPAPPQTATGLPPAGRSLPAGTDSPSPLAAPRRGRRRGEMTVARIARLAGVSAPTVSKVLNGHPGVAAGTRARVEVLLREHGYRRPEAVVPTASLEVVFYGMQSSLAIEIMQGVERVAGERKLSVGFTNVAGRGATGRSWAEDLLARRPTGVITAQFGVAPEQHGLLAASRIPVVALDPTGRPSHEVPSVGATNWNGGVMAAGHLLDLGHRHIAVITGPIDRLCARARLEGARAALEGAGLTLDERLVRSGRFSFDDGLEHGRALLTRSDPPTAVLCGNDLQALGVYEAARQLKVRIPRDLSVVGFDDISNALWCGPAMTTVRQPFREMGETAATMVLALAAGESHARRVELATTLMVRDSTAAPRSR